MKAHKVGIISTGHYDCKVGGWHCNCCAPSRQDRPLARRSVRRKMKQQDYKCLREEIENK